MQQRRHSTVPFCSVRRPDSVRHGTQNGDFARLRGAPPVAVGGGAAASLPIHARAARHVPHDAALLLPRRQYDVVSLLSVCTAKRIGVFERPNSAHYFHRPIRPTEQGKGMFLFELRATVGCCLNDLSTCPPPHFELVVCSRYRCSMFEEISSVRFGAAALLWQVRPVQDADASRAGARLDHDELERRDQRAPHDAHGAARQPRAHVDVPPQQGQNGACEPKFVRVRVCVLSGKKFVSENLNI